MKKKLKPQKKNCNGKCVFWKERRKKNKVWWRKCCEQNLNRLTISRETMNGELLKCATKITQNFCAHFAIIYLILWLQFFFTRCILFIWECIFWTFEAGFFIVLSFFISFSLFTAFYHSILLFTALTRSLLLFTALSRSLPLFTAPYHSLPLSASLSLKIWLWLWFWLYLRLRLYLLLIVFCLLSGELVLEPSPLFI